MKHLVLAFIMCLWATHIGAQDVGVSEEIAEPFRFPKLSFTGEYELNRKFHGFADERLRNDVERRFDGTLSFERVLARYISVGALAGVGMVNFEKPVHVRAGFFVKPIISLNERFSLFARVSTGIAVEVPLYSTAQEYYGSFDSDGNFSRVFKEQRYKGVPFGGFGGATLGLEVFPFSHVGLAFEWGLRATLLHTPRSMPFMDKPESKPGAPSYFNYMTYELPLMVTVHIII